MAEDQVTQQLQHRHMEEALAMAEEAYQVGEVPVGCVFVFKGEVVGRGRNETNISKNGTRHAELVAIDRMLQGGFKLEDFRKTQLYVTVEPCIMCASALRQMNIERVIYGCANDRFGGCESVLRVCDSSTLDGSRYAAEGGCYRDQAILMLRKFYMRENSGAPQPKKKANRVLKTQDLELAKQ
ncbi:tRNA(adenine34) deaminase [Coemansia guatemalensis]|uniref:tRNA(Adenine34) deaminase n=1 Tax=Coemansia guatemalensis TaxID=2761395 RepID=A0A9W8LRE8_9FUNG|nr:tRNA(adenine34) deaminase [Coemansia guatemalensis]